MVNISGKNTLTQPPDARIREKPKSCAAGIDPYETYGMPENGLFFILLSA
jgi:hypothetical protein